MNLKRIGTILAGALALTVVIFIININFYNDTGYTKSILYQILLRSFIEGLVVSTAVNIASHYRSKITNLNK
jgi:hypothetical protein